MTNPIGPAGFFALEAGECLDRLDSLFGKFHEGWHPSR